MKSLSILLLIVFFYSCKSDTRTEIVDRWGNGSKKTLVTYKGTGENEKLLKENRYTSTGRLFMKINHISSDTTFYPSIHINFSDSTYNGIWVGVDFYVDSSGHKILESDLNNDTLMIDGSYFIEKQFTDDFSSDGLMSDYVRITTQREGELNTTDSDDVWILNLSRLSNSVFLHELPFSDREIEVTSVMQSNLNTRELSSDGRIFYKQELEYDYVRFNDTSFSEPVDYNFFNTYLEKRKDTLVKIVKMDSITSKVFNYEKTNISY